MHGILRDPEVTRRWLAPRGKPESLRGHDHGQFDAHGDLGFSGRRAGRTVPCGPRSRYIVATSGQSNITRRAPVEDATAWLLPCLFVRVGHRAQGVTYAMVGAAVELARRKGAVAIEGWPGTASNKRAADAFLGREKVFKTPGFSCVERPSPRRAIMRLEFGRHPSNDEAAQDL